MRCLPPVTLHGAARVMPEPTRTPSRQRNDPGDGQVDDIGVKGETAATVVNPVDAEFHGKASPQVDRFRFGRSAAMGKQPLFPRADHDRGEAGDARPVAQNLGIGRGRSLDKSLQRGPGADKAHVAANDVPKLGQLIKSRAPKPCAEGCDPMAKIAAQGPLLAGRARCHGPQLYKAKGASRSTHPLAEVEYGPPMRRNGEDIETRQKPHRRNSEPSDQSEVGKSFGIHQQRTARGVLKLYHPQTVMVQLLRHSSNKPMEAIGAEPQSSHSRRLGTPIGGTALRSRFRLSSRYSGSSRPRWRSLRIPVSQRGSVRRQA